MYIMSAPIYLLRYLAHLTGGLPVFRACPLEQVASAQLDSTQRAHDKQLAALRETEAANSAHAEAAAQVRAVLWSLWDAEHSSWNLVPAGCCVSPHSFDLPWQPVFATCISFIPAEYLAQAASDVAALDSELQQLKAKLATLCQEQVEAMVSHWAWIEPHCNVSGRCWSGMV